MYLPDYRGGSIVNLMSSIGKARGARPRYKELRILPARSISKARTLILINVDGLGYDWLKRYGKGSALARHCVGSMTSVFPSTTAAASTCYVTGVPAQQHGMPGWFVYLKELGEVVVPLPWISRLGHHDLRRVGKHEEFFDLPAFADTLKTPAYQVFPKVIAHSAFTDTTKGKSRMIPYSSYGALVKSLVSLSKRPGKKYVYAYIPEFDGCSHDKGATHAMTKRTFAAIDRAFQRLTAQAKDAVIIVSSDHGEKAIPRKQGIWLRQHPILDTSIIVPLTGEPRAVFCFVRPDMKKEFVSYVRTRLKKVCTIHRSADLVIKGWFGLFKPHPSLNDRIGDFTLVMKDGFEIKDDLAGEHRSFNKADHGGTSKEEMIVPLVVARV